MPDEGVRKMNNEALAALNAAWTTTLVATTLLFVALGVSTVWDKHIYLRALRQALTQTVC